MAKEAATEPVAEQVESDRKELLRRAYGTATQRLRENHRDEFNKAYSAAAEELGVEWSPRLTEEEKAEQQFAELLARYPHLAEKVE